MDVNILKGLIGTTYSNFDMGTFENRLKLQKFFYILQEMHGLDLGYKFRWYSFGPYCTELSKEGFIVNDFKNPIQIEFEKSEDKTKFNSFFEFIKDKKEDVFLLEVISSIHLLNKLYPKKTKENIVREVMEKRDELKSKEKEITKIFDLLKLKGYIL